MFRDERAVFAHVGEQRYAEGAREGGTRIPGQLRLGVCAASRAVQARPEFRLVELARLRLQ